jgi:hypothetical protein
MNPHSFFEKQIPFLKVSCKAHNPVGHMEKMTHRGIEKYDRSITKHAVTLG